MISKTLVLLGLLSTVTAKLNEPTEEVIGDHLDLELMIDGERQLFPLLPGTRCPTGHNCRVRTVSDHVGVSPMIGSLKSSMKTHLTMTMDWQELNYNLNTLVESEHRCSRRRAMAKAAGMIAGATAMAVNQPAYAAQTTEVKMGADSGLLVFVPAKVSICSGDTVTWINNKAGPHNVVFDEDAIPAGVDQEAISMSDQLGEEGDTFSMKFEKVGSYDYYCEPHRGAGMQAKLVVA